MTRISMESFLAASQSRVIIYLTKRRGNGHADLT